jgi:small-conductance mechanosensitive channel
MITALQVCSCVACHFSRSPRPASKERSRTITEHFLLITFTCLCLLGTNASLAFTNSKTSNEAAHDQATASDSIAIENPGAPVEIDGRPIFSIYASVGSFGPQERADAIRQRIIALSGERGVGIETIHAEDRVGWTEILAGSERILGITESDARAAERPRAELAAEYTEIIRQVVKQHREEHTWRRYSWAALYALLSAAGTAALLVALFLIRRSARSRVEQWLARQEAQGLTRPVSSRLRRYLGPPFRVIFRTLFWILVLGLVQAYIVIVLRFFPSTKYTSYRLTNRLFSELVSFGKSCIGYVPNLLLIALVCLLTSYLIKLNRYIFQEISNERLTVRGFYPDWAEPTAKLVRVLIIAAAAIVVFPYLPGSESPAFKGISVFLGVLISLGSTSAVAHGVAGTILTYMRAFQVGDFVRIGNDVGEVIEKTLLVTRICTQKNEVVTIPNGTVLGGVVVNYSAEARYKGVIFHTTVTIGYNAPWRQVHDLLISAATATDEVLHDPLPFVLQTALNDFYVAYELNAYTGKPKNMQNIYSALHQNIQDKFNEAGVEINSPHYASLRDGNRTTIPDTYLPRNYKSPAFEIQGVNGQTVAMTEIKHV